MTNLAHTIMDAAQRVAAIRPTFAGYWLRNIAVMCDGGSEGFSPRIENRHYTAQGCVGYFTDPRDGQRYRISVDPIAAEQEFKSGVPE